MLSHNPMIATENCEYAGGVLPTNRRNVTAQARCGLVALAGVLERMKTLGIYDSATIVLMADHGAWVPPLDIGNQAEMSGANRAMGPLEMAMAVPVFGIKTPAARGPIKTLEAPSWIVDTPATVAAAAGIEQDFGGENALTLSASARRERRFHVYQYDRKEWQSNYLSPIQEFIVDGEVTDFDAWKLGKRYLPGGKD